MFYTIHWLIMTVLPTRGVKTSDSDGSRMVYQKGKEAIV